MQIVSPAPYLTIAERQELTQKNDLKALWGVFYHWGLIIGCFALVYHFPTVWAVIIAMLIIGGRQLACAILMHDGSHHAVFNSNGLNDIISNWFGAYPIFQDVLKYRGYHLQHHLNTGLEEDPDLLLTRGYPTTRRSMYRKFFRDLSGQTGIKALGGLVLMHLGYIEFNLGKKVVRVSQKDRSWTEFFKVFITNLGGPIITQLIIWALLYILASGWPYLLWFGAYLTTFQLSLRVRAIAEHSVLKDSTDPHKNTRTTRANLIEQLLFAPYYVNYHAEHHMMMSVPSYNLPKMHRLIKERGFYEKGVMAPGYWHIIKLAGSH